MVVCRKIDYFPPAADAPADEDPPEGRRPALDAAADAAELPLPPVPTQSAP